MSKNVRRQAFISAMTAGMTIRDAAMQVGVSEKTAHVWLHDPELAAALQQAQADVTREAMKRVLKAVSQAVAVLEEIMRDVNHPPAPRVSAAKTILDNALKAYDLEDVQKRLDALESRMENEKLR